MTLADHQNQRRMLENGSVDIAFLGTESTGYVDVSVTDIIREGNVEELSSYLQSDQGKELYGAYPEELWDAALVDGAQYFLPSEYMGYGMMYYVFNKAYFTESDVAQFDGSLEGLISLVEENVPDSVSYPPPLELRHRYDCQLVRISEPGFCVYFSGYRGSR